MKASLRIVVARVLIVTTTSALLPAPTHAGMIGTTERRVPGEREQIVLLLGRPEVAAQLEAYGINSSDAMARIAALSDADVALLSAEIHKAHAGAGGGGNAFAMLVFLPIAVLLLPFILLGALIVNAVGGSPKSAQTVAPEHRHQP